jgi:signal transduction histidine kinase
MALLGEPDPVADCPTNRSAMEDPARDAREAEGRAAAHLTVLAETSRALAEATLDVDRLLDTTARLASASLSAGCVVRLASEDRDALEVASLHHPDDDALARARALARDAWLRPSDGVPGEVLTTGTPRLVSDVATAVLPELPARVRALYDVFTVHSAMFVPLRARGRSLGLVTLVRGRGLPPFDADDLQFARDLVDRAALAIDNARLYRAAERAARAREEVLAVVAHDLRNPLGVITLCARLLPRRAPFDAAGDEIRATAERIRRAASRIEELVDGVLDAAKIERGKLAITPSRVEAGVLVRESVELLTVVARERGLSLDIEPGDAAGVPVLADAARVTQVFSNLIGNALRFTRTGGRIVVRATVAASHVRFDVEDTGVGIAPENLPRVFERFFRGETRERAGAGLGLFIAQGIVEAHGGTISVASTLGRGTTVSFTLPRAPA